VKTEDLVAMLAAGAEPVAPGAAVRRYAIALGWGACGALLLMLTLLGVRPDLGEAVWLPMFWAKLAFPALLAAGALYAAARLSQPGAQLGRAPEALAAPVLAMWLLALVALLNADGGRGALIFGSTWIVCPLLVALLSLPAFVAAMWAMRGLAPTRLTSAGAAAGLLAGAVGALIYAVHCPEMDAPFLAIWYLLGMLIPAAAGAACGPRLLRW
jgi:hypothetical protein